MAKVLIIGGGGREHALVKSIAKSPEVEIIYCAPGNGGTEREEKCTNITATTIPELLEFAKHYSIDLTIPGPEALLVEGITDAFRQEGLAIFGPHKKAAQLEGSKAFAKEFMARYGISTAKSHTFTSYTKAVERAKEESYPLVVKADGLAGGKGVIICNTQEEACIALKELMEQKSFGSAGERVILEQFLDGWEASFLVLYDGKSYQPMISAQDHKQIFDQSQGPNTGGMGVVAPNPRVTKALMQSIDQNIFVPTFRGIQEEAFPFCGVLFFGVMVVNDEPFLLEYNVRFGDPETQAVLPLLKSDLYTLLTSCTRQKLAATPLRWKRGSCCTVVMSAEGYPGVYRKGDTISGINTLTKGELFIAGATLCGETLETSGGRVLALSATAPTLKQARTRVYSSVEKIHFAGAHYRRDIGESS